MGPLDRPSDGPESQWVVRAARKIRNMPRNEPHNPLGEAHLAGSVCAGRACGTVNNRWTALAIGAPILPAYGQATERRWGTIS